ncbi:autotransporter beta-domain protein [Megaira polyxenophila phage MAnkyphage_25.80]|nr:autotransporter beta-domain protein [Megaira polyxenophila phage MAnkyphage_25.80]
MIDILERNLSFFRLLRNDKRIIESFDLDSGFASVIDYLNDVIVPAVNDMQAGALPGIMGSPNYFLTNVGDGSVTFNTLDRVIPDKTIATNKLIKSVYNGAVLISNNLGQLVITAPKNLNMVLTYRENNYPIYKFITTENIEDRAITYADIADKAIIKEHLHQEILDIIDAAVPNEMIGETLNITGNNFNDLSITTDKFTPNTITTFNKLGIIPNTLPVFPANESLYYSKIILRKHVKNGTITPNKIKLGTIGSLHFNRVKCITKNKLAAGVINETYFRLKQGEEYAYLSNDPDKRTFPFTARMLAPDFRVQRQHLVVASSDPMIVKTFSPVGVNDFEYKVSTALKRFGCI